MSASLVGSEMCIRDSPLMVATTAAFAGMVPASGRNNGFFWRGQVVAVSYTHLTLPTICSV
eukprot:8484495-Alexandrium_andersonii.AAC.1